MTFEPTKGSLPRKDLLLLPLISLLTVLLMIGAAEFTTRKIWPEKMRDDCFSVDPVLGNRFAPNCSTMRKNAEGPWIRYEYNECGYRGTTSCGPKPQGTLRIVLMGSSAAFGLDVPYDQHIAVRAAPGLAEVLGHPVEFQNLGGVGRDWSKNEMVLDEVLSLKPDAIFYFVMPFDLIRMDRLESELPQDADESFLLRAVQNYGDPLDVSRQPTPPLGEKRFALLDMIVGKLADRAREAHVPCFMIAVPNRAEVVMIRSNAQIPHMDPYIFPQQMQATAQRHGVAYIDLLPYLKNAPNAADLYYRVDGHPTGTFHELLTRILVDYFREWGSLSAPARSSGEH
jgi:hypothetical protein